jgi:hypothetical protein
VEGLLGANATRHVLYLLDGQYLYQTQSEDGTIQYKFLSAQSVRLAFSREPVDSSWLDPTVCRWGYGPLGEWAVSFIPPAQHSLWLSAEAVNGTTLQPTQELNHPLIAVPVSLPGLVLAGVGSNYYLWAVKAKTFSPTLVAYHPPLPNVYPDGRICWGNNQIGAVTAQNLSAAWQLFITSPFNSHLAQGKSKRYSQNILPQLRRLGTSTTSRSRKTYPVGDLVPVQNARERESWTIKGLVEQLIALNQRPGL